MATIVQARLNDAEERKLTQLTRELGWSPSKVVREGIKLVAATHPGKSHLRIIGLGKFASGKGDLGSNKRHLRGFGE